MGAPLLPAHGAPLNATDPWRDGRGPGGGLAAYAEYRRRTRVVLATAHLDHDPSNSRPRNLRALCWRCHILQRRALGDLFLGPYWR